MRRLSKWRYAMWRQSLNAALEALRAASLVKPTVADLQLEYAVAGQWTDGQLVSGYIDLVAVEDGRVDVIDFKTDTPIAGAMSKPTPIMPRKSGFTESCLKPPASSKIAICAVACCSPLTARFDGLTCKRASCFLKKTRLNF